MANNEQDGLNDRFINRHRITGLLVAETPLRIGAGEGGIDPTAPDNPVMRDPLGRPIIPGSSFKGVWRSTAEKLLAEWGEADGDVEVCNITEQACLTQKTAETVKKQSKNARATAQELYRRLCPVCRLFGNPHFSGRARIADLLVDAETWLNAYEIRPGVAIDRDSRIAMDERLYQTEVVPAGTAFQIDILVDNVSSSQWCNTLLTLMPFMHGEALIGGGTSRGLGRVRMNNAVVRTIDKMNLRQFLASGWDAVPQIALADEFNRLLDGLGEKKNV